MDKEIRHHLTDGLLMGYAAGNLPEAFNLVVATHISMCDECRAALAEYEAVGGELLAAEMACEMAEDSLEATLARIKAGAPEEPRRAAVAGGIFPGPLKDYLNGDETAVKWRRIGGGVSQMVIPTGGKETVRLLKIPAGTAVPDHGHGGTELTLVLQGAYADDHDRFGAGDIEVAGEDLEHTPVAETGADCICLIATDAPLRFNRFMPRIAQRIFRI